MIAATYAFLPSKENRFHSLPEIAYAWSGIIVITSTAMLEHAMVATALVTLASFWPGGWTSASRRQ